MNSQTDRKNQPYRGGELEVILSLVPTVDNIDYLSQLLGRSVEAIEIVYRIAYENRDFGKGAKSQYSKIQAAKKKLGIAIGSKPL